MTFLYLIRVDNVRVKRYNKSSVFGVLNGGSKMDILDRCVGIFSDVVDIVAEHPKESAAVVIVVGAFLGGYGKGYCDGRKDGDNSGYKHRADEL